MFKAIVNFFDRLEDKVRSSLSHRSFFYAFIGGVAHVIFWRGVWHTGDDLEKLGGFWQWFFSGPVSVIWATIVLLLTGLFVANFIGERIIISGLKKEKKVTDKTAREVESEDNQIRSLESKVDLLLEEIMEIKNVVSKK